LRCEREERKEKTGEGDYACGQLDRRAKQDDERPVEREKVILVAQRKKNN